MRPHRGRSGGVGNLRRLREESNKSGGRVHAVERVLGESTFFGQQHLQARRQPSCRVPPLRATCCAACSLRAPCIAVTNDSWLKRMHMHCTSARCHVDALDALCLSFVLHCVHRVRPSRWVCGRAAFVPGVARCRRLLPSWGCAVDDHASFPFVLHPPSATFAFWISHMSIVLEAFNSACPKSM